MKKQTHALNGSLPQEMQKISFSWQLSKFMDDLNSYASIMMRDQLGAHSLLANQDEIAAIKSVAQLIEGSSSYSQKSIDAGPRLIYVGPLTYKHIYNACCKTLLTSNSRCISLILCISSVEEYNKFKQLHEYVMAEGGCLSKRLQTCTLASFGSEKPRCSSSDRGVVINCNEKSSMQSYAKCTAAEHTMSDRIRESTSVEIGERNLHGYIEVSYFWYTESQRVHVIEQAAAIVGSFSLYFAQASNANKQALQFVEEVVQQIYVHKSAKTERQQRHYHFLQYAKSLNACITAPSIDVLEYIFSGKECILCGAGPSLDQQVKRIQATRNPVVIAVGSTIAILEDYGIRPSLCISVDPNESGYAAVKRAKENSTVPFAFCGRTNPKTIDHFTGPKYYIPILGNNNFENQLCNKLGYNVIDCSIYGIATSVTTAAMLVAARLKVSKIVLCGIDLSIVSGKRYAAASCNNNESTNLQVNSGLSQSKSIYATQEIMLHAGFFHEKRWINTFIKKSAIAVATTSPFAQLDIAAQCTYTYCNEKESACTLIGNAYESHLRKHRYLCNSAYLGEFLESVIHNAVCCLQLMKEVVDCLINGVKIHDPYVSVLLSDIKENYAYSVLLNNFLEAKEFLESFITNQNCTLNESAKESEWKVRTQNLIELFVKEILFCEGYIPLIKKMVHSVT